jgi:acyl-CoA synthetase (AMP-forming)/AMP-acid ligase II
VDSIVVGWNDASLPEDSSFLDLAYQSVVKKGSRVFATWYESHGRAKENRTFSELWDEAGVISYYLRHKWKLKKGDRAVLCYNFGLHSFAAFLGCLRAGVVAVIIYPPFAPLNKSLAKMKTVIADCDAKLILIDSDIASLKRTDKWNPFSRTHQEWPVESMFQVTTNLHCSMQAGQELLAFDEGTSPDDLAFLQYTSGSTGDPKGVMVTFGALTVNVKMIHSSFHQQLQNAYGKGDEIVGFSWLPQYHDMGLILAILAPFAGGWQMHMMAPTDFLRNPLLWLDLMSQLKVCWGAAPDFAYRLVSRKFIEARDRDGGRKPDPGARSVFHLLPC